MLNSKDIKFTADDWGLSEGVNDAILDLASTAKIHTVSVMICSPKLNYRLEELLKTNVSFSLHLNLTEGTPLGPVEYLGAISKNGKFLGPVKLFLKVLFYKCALEQLSMEAVTQIKMGQRLFGPRLVEIDGHHHVHLIPGLVERLEEVLLSTSITRLRIPLDSSHFLSAYFGRRLLKRRARAQSLDLISYGYFDPRPSKLKSMTFEHYLCHPGLDETESSKWGRRRLLEYKTLQSLGSFL